MKMPSRQLYSLWPALRVGEVGLHQLKSFRGAGQRTQRLHLVGAVQRAHRPTHPEAVGQQLTNTVQSDEARSAGHKDWALLLLQLLGTLRWLLLGPVPLSPSLIHLLLIVRTSLLMLATRLLLLTAGQLLGSLLLGLLLAIRKLLGSLKLIFSPLLLLARHTVAWHTVAAAHAPNNNQQWWWRTW